MTAKLTILCIFMLPAALRSQSVADSNYQYAIAKAIELYHSTINEQAPVYSGPQYIRFPYPIVEGQAFYTMDKLATGAVIYDGIRYDGVQLMYDEIRDQLVISDYQHTTLLLLYGKKVSWFELFGQQFTRLDKDSAEGIKNDMGFCQVLYNGRSKVYKKEIKSIVTRAENSQSLSRYIETKTSYYINNNHQLHEIGNEKDLLDAYAVNKKELSQYLRSNKLKFRKNKETVIIKAAAFIEQSKQ